MRKLFGATSAPEGPELGDIYPGRQTVAVYERDGERLLAELTWGFARNFAGKAKAINDVRAETIDEKLEIKSFLSA